MFALTALVLGFVTLETIGAGVWGAPVSLVQYVAFFGALLLAVSSLISLYSPASGRILAIVSLIASGVWWIPLSASIVPVHNVGAFASALALMCIGIYVCCLAFALLYPTPRQWSRPTLTAVLLISIGIVARTVATRATEGEFAWPSITCFRWIPGDYPLIVRSDPEGTLTQNELARLQQAGIRGSLEWEHRSGDQYARHRVLVLMTGQASVPQRLYFPKGASIVYTFDGRSWQTIPDHAAVYPSYARLEPQGRFTMLWDGPDSSASGSAAFAW